MKSNSLYSSLFLEFPELEAEDVSFQKEVYAHFGLLFSAYAILEAAVQNCYIFWELRRTLLRKEIKSEEEWQQRSENLEKNAFSSTFGSLLNLVSNYTELSDILGELRVLKKNRDYFAHHFFREENPKMFSDATSLHLIFGMNQLRSRVHEASKSVDLATNEILREIYPKIDISTKFSELEAELKDSFLQNPPMTFGWD